MMVSNMTSSENTDLFWKFQWWLLFFFFLVIRAWSVPFCFSVEASQEETTWSGQRKVAERRMEAAPTIQLGFPISSCENQKQAIESARISRWEHTDQSQCLQQKRPQHKHECSFFKKSTPVFGQQGSLKTSLPSGLLYIGDDWPPSFSVRLVEFVCCKTVKGLLMS